jgi:hypothetical protein
MAALKSFGMLVTGIGEGAGHRVIGSSGDYPNAPKPGAPGAPGDRVIGKPNPSGHQVSAAPTPVPEARYAYYRRCHNFLRNGNQCKAPAMKGEPICHQHAQQADNNRRREQQRRELLSRPGLGFGSFDAIQRTIGAVANALLAGEIDHKVAGRLMMQVQIAIRLQKIAARLQKRITRNREIKSSGHRKIGKSEARNFNVGFPITRSPDHRITRFP